MKKITVFLAATMVAVAAFAGASGVGNSYIIVNSAWYNGSGAGNTDLFGSNGTVGGDLGTITSLVLGGELTVYTDDYAPGWGDAWGGDYMGYYVTSSEDRQTKIIGDTMINLTKVDGSDNTIKIQNNPGVSVDISSLADGKYNLEVFFGGVDSKWDGGNNYVASFTKAAASEVPEPATMSLLGLGALALALRRKLRK